MSKHLQTIIKKMSQNMTQSEIAKELGITQPAISQMLKRVKFCPHCHKPLFKEETTKEKCKHVYSRSMDQEYPRKCLKCGQAEKAIYRRLNK